MYICVCEKRIWEYGGRIEEDKKENERHGERERERERESIYISGILTQVKMVTIAQKLWKIKELWNEFFDISHVCFTS